jgi:glycosyltransferase involved in cell wall biosynthesis
MNWIHRRVRTGIRHFLKAEYGNLLLRIIRSRIANHVVYQSQFARTWWTEAHASAPCTESVVFNAVPLQTFSPAANRILPNDRWRLLLLEGRFEGGYETGLRASIDMLAQLQVKSEKPIELDVVGSVPERMRLEFANTPVAVEWLGVLPHDEIPRVLNGVHVLVSADINPACPNSVIESLACGTPVVGFNTGAMQELVSGDCGVLADYGSDPWMLEMPRTEGLVTATMKAIGDHERLSKGARARAENAFGLDDMVAGYIQAFSLASKA